MGGIPLIGIAELALHVRLKPSRTAWILFVVPTAAQRSATDELRSELNDLPVEIVTAARADAIANAAEGRSGVLIIYGVDGMPIDEWGRLDLERSRLLRAERSVLLLDERTLSAVSHAPHLMSLVGGDVFRLNPDADWLSDDDRERRLSALREHTGRTNEDVVRDAERGTLPADPEFAEWLILLGRGDLVVRR